MLNRTVYSKIQRDMYEIQEVTTRYEVQGHEFMSCRQLTRQKNYQISMKTVNKELYQKKSHVKKFHQG